jgi:hypothetical protein
MAKYQINHYVDTPFGKLHVFSDPDETRRAEELIKRTPKILFDAYKDAAERFGKDIITKARRCIDTQTPPHGVNWPKLSSRYVARMAGDDRIYLKSYQYYEAIGIYKDHVYYQSGKLAKTRIFVGLPTQVKKVHPRFNRDTKLTLIQVANILEMGTRNERIPPRPLWKPLFQDMKGNERIKTFIKNSIIRQLKKYT